MNLVDANVVLCLLVEGREQQRTSAITYLEALDEPAVITESVLVEVCWALEAHYRFERAFAARAVRDLAQTRSLTLWDPATGSAALRVVERWPKLAVADALLLVRARSSGAEVLTFDRELQAHLNAESGTSS